MTINALNTLEHMSKTPTHSPVGVNEENAQVTRSHQHLGWTGTRRSRIKHPSAVFNQSWAHSSKGKKNATKREQEVLQVLAKDSDVLPLNVPQSYRS
jgi:hypothetical protein